MKTHTVKSLAKVIDHSLLNPTLTDAQMIEGVELAKRLGVASVCVKPYFVSMAAEILKGSGVAVGTVIGFPHGGHMTSLKFLEAQQAIHEGATELDIVVNIGKVLSGDWDYVEVDLRAVLNVCKTRGAVSKVIFENCYLEEKHKIKLCEVCERLGAGFVKTSTGYGSGGATDEDIQLMRANVSSKTGVKAAGGVRTLDRLLEVLDLGATRVGCTATASILEEAAKRFSKT
ncbi:MAG TPA: deoxyribose-phosphate aldolase [bacterium]|nr:deoxyribose-phosphate aldolase [bacterium]